MVVNLFRRNVKSFGRHVDSKQAPDVRSAKEFRAIIQRECACVNRNSHRFSLIILDLEKVETGKASVSRLIFFLIRRVRCTDEIGWLDERRIGVALRYSDIGGARKLANEIHNRLCIDWPSLRCTVHTYPVDWWSENKDGARQLCLFDSLPEFHTSLSGDISRLTEPSAKSPAGSVIQSALQEKPVSISVKRLEPLITPSIPTWKRCVDVVGSLIGLMLFSPLLLLAFIMIKTMSLGPVLLKQKRVGYLGKPFSLLKFRTMKVNVDTSAHRQYVKKLIKDDLNQNNGEPMRKLNNDPRIIPFGELLRKTCIDEFPQLINVLRGEMSLIGPRPCLPYEAQEYFLWNTERFNTIPGMSGLWQVKGKNKLTFEEMIRLDITYARQRSLWLDMKILLMTLPAIILDIIDNRQKK